MKKFSPAVVQAIAEAKLSAPHLEGTPSLEKDSIIYFKFVAIPAADDMKREGVSRRVWTLVDKCTYNTVGELVTREIDAYAKYVAVEGHNSDICPYCGADNGPDSESRVGLDCYCCGSN